MASLLTTAFMGLFAFSGVTLTQATSTPAMAPEPLARHTVALTAYNALPEQTDEDPFTTASGAYSNPEVIAARSVDLASELPFGTVIEISTEGSENGSACGLSLIEDQVGYRVVADSMNPRIKGTVDLLLDHDNSVQVGKKKVNPARALGRCKNIEIKVLGRIDVKEIPATQAELKRVVSEGTLALKKW